MYVPPRQGFAGQGFNGRIVPLGQRPYTGLRIARDHFRGGINLYQCINTLIQGFGLSFDSF